MSEVKQAKSRSFFVTTLPLFMMAHFGHHLMTALPAVLIPFIRDDTTLTGSALSYTQSAWVISAFSLAYGFGQLPGGWLADRIGRLAMIAMGIFGVALVGILVGFSQTYTWLLILLVIMGIAGGGYHPAATPWISASAGEKNQGRAIGYHFVGGGSGFFVAPFIGAAVAATWGWHTSFFVLAAPCAIFGIIFFFILRRQKNSQLKEVAGHPHFNATAARDNWRPLIALLFMSMILGGMISVMSFLSLYLVDQFNVAKSTAVFIVAIASFAGIWAGPLGGHISDRIGRVPIIIICSILTGVLISCIRWIPYGPALLAFLFFAGINSTLNAPVVEAYIMGQTSPRHRSLIYGIYYLSGQSGALFAPLIGLMIDNFGFQNTSMVAGLTAAVVAVICGWVIWTSKTAPSQVPEVTE